MDSKELEKELKKVKEHFEYVLSKIQTGKASIWSIEEINVYVPSWGQTQKIQGLWNVSLLDSQTIKIEAWDRSVLSHIEKWIYDANLGLTPLNQWERILIKVPPMTEERRKDIVKQVKKESEETKISVRNIRHSFLKNIKTEFDNKEISEDEKKQYENELDDIIKKENKNLESISKQKEDQIMKISA